MSDLVTTQIRALTAPGTSQPVRAPNGSHVLTATVTGSGSVAAALTWQGSNDLLGWVTLGTLSASGTGVAGGSASTALDYAYWQVRLDSMTGAQCAVSIATAPAEDASNSSPFTPAEVASIKGVVSGAWISATPAALAATAGNRIRSALTNAAIVGHRGLGGYATGTAGTLPTPDPMAGSVGTDPEGALSSVLKGFALGVRIFELDVWGANGYMCHDQDPRRVARAPAFIATEFVTCDSYRTNGGNTYRAISDGICGATAPTGTALTPVSDGTVGWLWVGAALPTDITALSVSAYRDLRISATYFMGPGYENQPFTTLRDLLSAIGNRCMFILEAKDAAGGRAIASALKEFNVPADLVLVASFTSAWTLEARRAGYSTLQYGADANALTTAQVISAGAIGYATLDQDTWTSAKVAEFHAAGLLVGASLNLQSHTNYAAVTAAGVDYVIGAEPLYISGLGAIDDGVWMDGRWPAGMVCEDTIPSLSQGGRGVLKPSSTGVMGWGFSTSTSSPKGVLMGQFVLPTTFKRRFWLQIPASSASNQGLWMAICCPTDKKFTESAGNYGEGYLVRLRKSGVMDLYVCTTGMTIGTPDATATATGLGTDLATNRCQFELEVSATEIKITNITGGNITATLTNSTYRGRYMHMGRTNATYVVDTWQAIA